MCVCQSDAAGGLKEDKEQRRERERMWVGEQIAKWTEEVELHSANVHHALVVEGAVLRIALERDEYGEGKSSHITAPPDGDTCDWLRNLTEGVLHAYGLR